MHVVATAGHVDHGKSTLIRALTGMEPDRWAEERRRGMTIDLGFAWTELPARPDPQGRARGPQTIAFVDVPGHERFVTTMLAGVGPVPAVLLVVAADEGWMPQSSEHLDACTALGVSDGLLVITRCDLMEPGPALMEARERLAGTPLAGIPAVGVSAVTGAGLAELRSALDGLIGRLPAPDAGADVRFWVDRAFTIRGAGTIVTGTLGAGEIRQDDELELITAGGARPVRVRGLQTLGAAATAVTGVARIALNLRGVPRDAVARGDVLVTPTAWLGADLVDVRLHAVRRTGPAGHDPADEYRADGDPADGCPADGDAVGECPAGADHDREYPVGPVAGGVDPRSLPGQLIAHLGAAAVPVRIRPLGPDTARLRWARPLPLRIGDRAVLRDPGRREVAAGLTVLDVRPPPLRRRGAAARRAVELITVTGRPSAAGELRRRGFARRTDLIAMGVPAADVDGCARAGAPSAAGWIVDPERAAVLAVELAAAVAAHDAADPLDPGLPVEAARRAVGLPEPRLIDAVLAAAARGVATAVPGAAADTALVLRDGRVCRVAAGGLPRPVRAALERLRLDLQRAPFVAPGAARLAELGLGPRELASLVKAGELIRVGDGVLLLPGADQRALTVLAGLGPTFTLSAARQALGTSRRVAVPLLELLHRRGLTERTGDGGHRLA